MSLYGSLFSGVSGLGAQGSAISIIADNVANINTVGYKAGQAIFSTLVTAAATSTTYASGGVTATNRQLLDQQGTIQSTGVVSDIAVSGNGFFVVNSASDGSGDYLYTRAGSFRKDAKGNFVNAAGYTLMGWPLDNSLKLPGQAGNLNTVSSALLESTQPVNVKSVTGSASATTTVSLGLNLDEAQKVFQGAGETIMPPVSAPANYNIGANDVISPENSGTNILNIDDSITLTPSTPGTPYRYTYGGLAISNDISAGILGATTSTGTFTGATAGSSFTIDNPISGLVTYTYTPNSPNITKGQFNTLSSLAAAINQTNGLTARVDVTSKKLLIAPKDATQAMTFTQVAGSTDDFVSALNLASTTAAANRFATLQSLANLVNNSAGTSAIIANPLSSTSLKLYSTNPLGTLTVDATSITPSVASSNSILSTLGLSVNTDPASSANHFGPAYDANLNNKNMSGGKVTPHLSRNVRMFDAFGTGHDFQTSYLNIGTNTWAVEVYALNPSELISSRTDGQIASGTFVFNGDGSLRTVSSTLTNPINILWANQAEPSNVTFNWGTAGEIEGTVGATSIGKRDGVRQLNASYNVEFADQNGIASGLLNGINIDESGYVIANFTNGTSRKIFQLPLADFASPNGLQNRGGNAYGETNYSGNFNLKQPNSGGIGKITPGSLEAANVELADELTKMVLAQKGYQANSKVIKTVNETLDELMRSL